MPCDGLGIPSHLPTVSSDYCRDELRSQRTQVYYSHWTRHSPQLPLSKVVDLKGVSNGRGQAAVGQDLPISGIGTEACCKIYYRANGGVLQPICKADGAHGGIALCQANPESQ